MVPPSGQPLAERLECFHLDFVDVFGNILDPELENDLHIFKQKVMEAIQIHNIRMILKVHVRTHHVPKYVRRTGVPAGLLLSSRWRVRIGFIIFSTTDSKRIVRTTRFLRTFTECCITL